ncbi:MAG: ribose 5-phosphate isomerase B [bacterium]
MKIAFGNDHAAAAMRDALVGFLREQGHEVMDLGWKGKESVDYPDFARSVAEKVARGEADRGVLICGTGIGMAIAANKVAGIRAAVGTDLFEAEYMRRHNDVNVLALRAREQTLERNQEILKVWLETLFEGGKAPEACR